MPFASANLGVIRTVHLPNSRCYSGNGAVRLCTGTTTPAGRSEPHAGSLPRPWFEEGSLGASPVWHKSTHSGSPSDDCIEVTQTASSVLIRDSKRPAGPTLLLSRSAWHLFVHHVSPVPRQQAA
ncbi:DUF397 domain-containing protein [Streptomyces sp. NBC_00414]|uniref:DUF397 domain-containing protein n=1 Tax=Streptomyces sp. NBC_00414 TaxID=2975739 RepID=UPI002E1D8027